MVVLDGHHFFKFVEANLERFSNSPTIMNLINLKRVAMTCCKCERKQKLEVAVHAFDTMGERINEEEKDLIKELNDNQSVKVTRGDLQILEI